MTLEEILKDIPDTVILNALDNMYPSNSKTALTFPTLEDYIERMAQNGITKWPIGWESLPKYIGHRIYNVNTNQIATVQWDVYPKLIGIDGNELPLHCNDFSHSASYWIYDVEERYDINE